METGIEQAGTQVNRPKCHYKPPEKQTKFKDETGHLLIEKFPRRGWVGKAANGNTDIIRDSLLYYLINVISNIRYYLYISFSHYTSSEDVEKDLPQNSHKYIKLNKEAKCSKIKY